MSLSVIIPNYNNEKYISKCIDSVLSQSFLPDEIIIVDDCSSDSSVDIIKEYADKYSLVKPIFLSENIGVSSARNIGLKASKSEFVTTLDADDFYFNNKKLENEMKLISDYNGHIVSYSKIVFCDEQDRIIRYLDYPKGEYFEGYIYTKLISGRITRTLMRDYIFPKSILTETGFYDKDKNLFEDFDFLIRLSKRLQFVCTFQFGTAYRQKKDGLSHRPIEEVKSVKKAIIDYYLSGCSIKENIEIFFYKLLNPFFRMFNQIRLILFRKK